jgi:hypothetical protein
MKRLFEPERQRKAKLQEETLKRQSIQELKKQKLFEKRTAVSLPSCLFCFVS